MKMVNKFAVILFSLYVLCFGGWVYLFTAAKDSLLTWRRRTLIYTMLFLLCNNNKTRLMSFVSIIK